MFVLSLFLFVVCVGWVCVWCVRCGVVWYCVMVLFVVVLLLCLV